MSTTFGVKVPSIYDEDVTETIEVAFRGNGGYIRWKAPLAHLLPDDVEVIPLDNSVQGIYTIGDLRKNIDVT